MRKKRIPVTRWTIVLVLLLFFATVAGAGEIRVGPSDPWCDAINRALPGDAIILAPGSYDKTCWISARGLPGVPITVRSQGEDASQRAKFEYAGTSANVMELTDAAHLILRGLSFGPTEADVDALRIRRANDVIIERNIFQGIGGISIAANDSGTQRITVRDNTFKGLKATGIYFGCQDGTSCQAVDFVLERNLIDGVTTPYEPSAIGYGMEVKLNSYGTIRDNTIYRTKGPGIMIYGSSEGYPGNLVEGNYVEGSLTEGGIVVGGGPGIVRNNVLVGNAYGGISAQDYGGRDLQRSVWIIHNTLLHNDDAGINVAAWRDGRDNVIAFNAILPKAGTAALRPSLPAGSIAGNVTCSSSCFVNAAVPPYDLWPQGAGPLVDAAGSGNESWRPRDDFMGVARTTAADIGAFEKTSLAIDHSVGGGQPRPPRISTDMIPPSPPRNLRIQ